MIDIGRVERYARRLDWRSRGAGSEMVTGSHRSRFHGQGSTFRGHRPYQWGDDVRHIDWNVTARQGQPFVKTFDADRASTVLLLVDVSRSLFSMADTRKAQVAKELVALFALIAGRNGDRVGALFFASRIERVIRPGRGVSKAREIVRAACGHQGDDGRTNLADACAAAHRHLRKSGTVLVISDFYDQGYERGLRLLALKHDVVAVALLDPAEARPPFNGLFRVEDPESGTSRWIDGASPRIRAAWAVRWQALQNARREACAGADVPCVDVLVDRSYLPPLLRICRVRGHLRWR